MKFLKTIKGLEGIKALIANGAEIFAVGGIVRDFHLNKKSKDIDLIIRLLEINDIEKILQPHGFVKKDVGKSFSVLKFVPTGWGNDDAIDIALPRTEKKIGAGHKGFEVTANPFLPIEEDLKRRDITINSIAVCINDGRIIDPFGGLEDIKRKFIKATSNQAFIEDPLRILRAIQFASRFEGFVIDEETFKLILDNVHSLDEISGERITTELDKIFEKGDINVGFELLRDTNALRQITGCEPIDFQVESKLTRSEFFFLLFQGSPSPEKVFKFRLKGDKDTISGIEALSIFKRKFSIELTEIDRRFLMSELIDKTNEVFNFSTLKGLEIETLQFKAKEFPAKITDLDINGDILMEKGLKGKEVGDRLKLLHCEVLQGKRINTLKELLK